MIKLYVDNNKEMKKEMAEKIESLRVDIDRERAEKIIEVYNKNKFYYISKDSKDEIKYRGDDKKAFYIDSKSNVMEYTDKETKDIIRITKDTMFINIKGEDKELLRDMSELYKYIMNSGYAVYETEEEREMNIDNLRRYIRVNSYDKLGKWEYSNDNRERERKEIKDKEGNDIKIKKGFLYKCDKCKSYEPIESIDAVLVLSIRERNTLDKEGNTVKTEEYAVLTGIIINGIECSVCKDIPDYNKVTYLGTSNHYNGVIGKNMFNDLAEKGKITISSIRLEKSFFGDRCKQKTLSNKIVFNIEKGRAYSLPTFNIDTKKKKGNLEQLGLNNMHQASMKVNISLKHVCEIGLLMEEYMKEKDIVNKKAIIPFSEYIMNIAAKSSDKEQIIKYIKAVLNKEETTDKYDEKIDHIMSGYDKLAILVFYNQNPYINYLDYKDIARVRNFRYDNGFDYNIVLPSKIRNVKRLRNTNLLKDLAELFSSKTKIERKFIAESESKLSAYVYLSKVKAVFNSQENINKFLIASADSFKKDYFSSVSVHINSNPYLERLIKEFGETAVANALTKDAIEYNKIKAKERLKIEKYNQNATNIFQLEGPSYNQYNHYNRGQRNDILYNDTVRNYIDIITVFPEYKLPVDRLRLKDLHDKIAKDASKIKHKEKFYNYEDKFMDMYDNKVIEDIEFKVALSNIELTAIGSQMGICVGGYWNRVEKGELFIVTMQKEGNYIGCLEISKNGELHQAKAKYNHRLEDNYLELLKQYCIMTNLTIDTHDVKDEYKVKKDKSKESVIYKNAINIIITSDVTEEDLLKEIEDNRETIVAPNNMFFNDFDDEIPFDFPEVAF